MKFFKKAAFFALCKNFSTNLALKLNLIFAIASNKSSQFISKSLQENHKRACKLIVKSNHNFTTPSNLHSHINSRIIFFHFRHHEVRIISNLTFILFYPKVLWCTYVRAYIYINLRWNYPQLFNINWRMRSIVNIHKIFIKILASTMLLFLSWGG